MLKLGAPSWDTDTQPFKSTKKIFSFELHVLVNGILSTIFTFVSLLSKQLGTILAFVKLWRTSQIPAQLSQTVFHSPNFFIRCNFMPLTGGASWEDALECYLVPVTIAFCGISNCLAEDIEPPNKSAFSAMRRNNWCPIFRQAYKFLHYELRHRNKWSKQKM